MQNLDETFIVCLTVRMGQWNPSSVVEGSIEKNCAECRQLIYLSLSGQKMLQDTPHAILICMPCVQKKIANEETPEFSIVPGAIEEIERAKKKQ